MGTTHSTVIKADVKRAGKKEGFSPFMKAMTRLGYGGRGQIYIIMSLLAFQLLFMATFGAEAAITVLVGDTNIEANLDYNAAGMAEAFQFAATNSGTINKIYVYIDGSSTATQVVMGLYSDVNNNPGSLLTQGIILNPTKGAWNSVAVPPASVGQSSQYWIAILGPASNGEVRFRDVQTGGAAQTSAQSNLTALPVTWSKGNSWTNSPISAYAVEETSVSTPTSSATTITTITLTSSPSPTATRTPTATLQASSTATWTSTATLRPRPRLPGPPLPRYRPRPQLPGPPLPRYRPRPQLLGPQPPPCSRPTRGHQSHRCFFR